MSVQRETDDIRAYIQNTGGPKLCLEIGYWRGVVTVSTPERRIVTEGKTLHTVLKHHGRKLRRAQEKDRVRS